MSEQNSFHLNLRKLMESKRISARRLSLQIGKNQRYVTDLFERGSMPGIEESKAIANFFHVSVDWFLTGGDVDMARLAIQRVPVRGNAGAGEFYSTADFAEVIDYDPDGMPIGMFVPAVPGIFPGLEQFAYRISGQSMNKEYRDGEFVICVPYFDARGALTPRDHVIVSSQTDSLDYEITCKELRATKTHWELWPLSTDPRYQKPIRVERSHNAGEGDDSSIEVMGLVIGSYRPRPM